VPVRAEEGLARYPEVLLNQVRCQPVEENKAEDGIAADREKGGADALAVPEQEPACPSYILKTNALLASALVV
jgi:hypothetical protein